MITELSQTEPIKSLKGEDQKLLQEIGFLRGRVVQGSLDEVNAKRVYSTLTLAMRNLNTLKLNKSDLSEMAYLIKDLDKGLQKQQNIEEIILNILKKLHLDIDVSKDPLKHPLIAGMHVVVDEFDVYDAQINLSLFPARADNPESYLQLLKEFDGRTQTLSKHKVANFLDDPCLCKDSKVYDRYSKISIPDQTLLDIRRIDKLIVNRRIIHQINASQYDNLSEMDLFEAYAEELNEPIEILIDLAKLITQASLARPYFMLFYGFSFPDLNIRLTSALSTSVEIQKRDEQSFTVLHKAVFGLTDKESSQSFKFLTVMRQFTMDREFLGVPALERKGEAKIIDLYSRPFDHLTEASKSSFDQLQKSISTPLLDREASQDASENPSSTCVII